MAQCASEFTTRYFLPAWWVNTYSKLLSLSGSDLDPLKRTWLTQMSPSWNESEWNAGCIVLSGIQNKLLAQQKVVDRVEIDPAEFLKQSPRADRLRRETLLGVIGQLESLMLYLPKGSDLVPLRFFSEGKWIAKDDTKSQAFKLSLNINPIAAQLLLGYSLSHIRLFPKNSPLFLSDVGPNIDGVASFFRNSPLSMWRSVWNELGVVEQTALLVIEESMQWQENWLHFDGVFACSLTRILSCFSRSAIQKRLGASVNSTVKYEKTRLLLEKFGKTLCHHGLLKFEMGDEFWALNEGEREDLLVWQASPQKLSEDEPHKYRSRCADFIVRNQLHDTLDDFFSYLLDERSLSKISLFRSVWFEILSRTKPGDLACNVDQRSGFLFVSILLFFEWAARLSGRHFFPVPAHLQNLRLADLCVFDEVDTGVRQYFEFAQMLSENSDLWRLFESDVFASLGSEVSIKANKKQISDWQVSLGKNKATEIVLSPSNKIFPPSSQMAADLSVNVPKAVENESHSADTSAKHTSLRKVAADELAKIAQHEPENYLQLKNSFLQSLDPQRRKIISDLKQRLPEMQFEQHLKHSLIRYMIENPSAWKSAKTGASVQ